MFKISFTVFMAALLFSSTAHAQSDVSRTAPETFARLYRLASLTCRAPECTMVNRPRRMPTTTIEYQEANSFLVPVRREGTEVRVRACLVDCTCTVQGSSRPTYCGATAAVELTPVAPPPAPATTPAAENAETEASTEASVAPQAPAVTPVQPPLPPGMFSMFGLGSAVSTMDPSATAGAQTICGGTADTLATLGQLNTMGAGITAGSGLQFFDATWQMTTAPVGRSLPGMIAFHVSPSPYAMVVSLRYAVQTPNGLRNYVKEVVPFNNGRPVLHQAVRQSGGTCARGAIPPNVNANFYMQWEGMATNFELEVTCYHVTPASRPVAGPVSGIVLGTPVRGGTIRRQFTSADGLVSGRVYEFGCGL